MLFTARYKTEVEFLQGAFESYKSQNHREHQASLKELKEELKEAHHSDMQAHLKDLGEHNYINHSVFLLS